MFHPATQNIYDTVPQIGSNMLELQVFGSKGESIVMQSFNHVA